MKKTLFVPIVASINLRDLVTSGVLKEIQRSTHAHIVVLHALPLTPGVKKLFTGLDVTFEEIPEVPFEKHRRFFSMKRTRSFVYALANPDLKKIRITAGTFKSGTYGEKMPAVHYLLKFFDATNNRLFVKFYSWLRLALMRYDIRTTVDEDEQYQKLFDKYKPDLVLNHGPYARAHLPVQRTAIRNNVPLIGVINSWDNVTSSGELNMKMTHLLVWSDLMKQEAVHYLKYKPKEITATGALQFDPYFHMKTRSKAAFCKAHGLDPKKKIITYTCSSELHFPQEHMIVERIHEIVSTEPALKDYQLLVRLYPMNTKVDPYKALEKKGVRIQYVSNVKMQEERFLPDEQFLRTLVETIKYSDIISNYPSTIILDAAIFTKPVVTIGFDATPTDDFYKSAKRFFSYEHIGYIVKSKATIITNSYEELREALVHLAKHPHAKDKEIKAFQNWIAGNVDGKVYRRVAAFVTAQLKK